MRISALAVAIFAGALSVAAVNCQSDPEPTPTTVPTAAPTATESYVPPTLTPTRTPVPEPTPTPTPTPTKGLTPTQIAPETEPEQIHEIVLSNHNRRYQLPQSMDGLYPINLQVDIEVWHLAPDSPPATLELVCKNDAEPSRPCGEPWTTSYESYIETFHDLILPAGNNEVTIEHDGVPLARALVIIAPGALSLIPQNIDDIDTVLVDVVWEGQIIDSFAPRGFVPEGPGFVTQSCEEHPVCVRFVPEGSNGLVPRVTGYWSDGSANIEIFAGSQTVRPTDSISCQREDEQPLECDVELSAVADGKYTRILTRLPVGATTTISAQRDGEVVIEAPVTVSARLIGIPADIFKCFTDTTFEDVGSLPDGAIGCAGWQQPAVLKWEYGIPLRVRINGPDQWTDFFKAELEALQPLFNIDFQWVQGNRYANMNATVGITHEAALQQDLGCSPEPVTAGCATTGIDPLDSSAEHNHIVIYNLNPDEDNPDALPASERELNELRRTILHEAVHAFTGMGHRIEVGSLMSSQYNEFRPTRYDLSPMDRALVQIHALPEFEHGTELRDIRHFAIPNDELLDPQTDPREPTPGFFAWKAVSTAFHKIRETATATYDINTSMPGCQQQVSGATYQVAKLAPGSREFQWSRLTSDALNTLHIATLTESNFNTETWELMDSSWQTVDHSHEAHGWIPGLSDPYHLIVDILVRADWNNINLTKQGSKSIISATESVFPAGFELGSFQLTIDNDSSTVTDYELNWNRSYDGCDGYLVTATNGTYSDGFTFPTAVRTESELLSDCETTSLPTNPRAHRVSDRWHQECPAQMPATEYSQAYRFETDAWSLLRIDFQSPDDAILSFTDLSIGATQTLLPSRGRPFPDGLEGYGLRIEDIDPFQFGLPPRGSYIWRHQWLPPGQYEIQAATRERAFPGRFTLIVDAQPIPGPPESLKFKAVATSNDRTCALLTDGNPLCWGRPYDTRTEPTIPGGPFENIYGGFHFCATTADGPAQCWDYAEAGNHVCTHVGGDSVARYCYGANQPETSDNQGLVDKSSIYVPAWYYDQTPPEGEVLINLAPGRDHTCGIRQDHTAICWGDISYGESKPPDDTKFVDIVNGSAFSCGITTQRQTVCWGEEWPLNKNTPPDKEFNSIGTTATVDYNRTCGIDGAGHVTCVGVPVFCIPDALYSSPCWRIRFDPDYEPQYWEDPPYWYDEEQPTPYDPAPGSTFTTLSTEAPECGIKADRTAECWHPWGSVGSPPATETFTQISAGTRHVCGLRTDGTIACWGDNFYGQASPPNGDLIQSERNIRLTLSDLTSGQ